MDDKQAMHAMSIDDAYHVERTLARGPSGVTELVSIDGNGPFVRKKIPSPLAQRNVWAALSACQSNRLPRVEATYELPDRFVIVYDYVPGSTLAQIAEENGRLAPNVAVQLIDQICEAVQELHQHGVISTATSRRPTSSWPRMARISSISASRASGQRQATVHGIPRRLAPTDSPRLSNMALPKPTRVPTYSRWAGYSDSC